MAIREYIGARYVPKFYDDGQGGAEWTNTVEYEPLTIVQYQGNSYTSRQYVPVGIAITNTDYWLLTGNWQSQVEQYRQEVYAFDGRITQNATDIADLEADLTAEENARIAADKDLQDAIAKIQEGTTLGVLMFGQMSFDYNNGMPDHPGCIAQVGNVQYILSSPLSEDTVGTGTEKGHFRSISIAGDADYYNNSVERDYGHANSMCYSDELQSLLYAPLWRKPASTPTTVNWCDYAEILNTDGTIGRKIGISGFNGRVKAVSCDHVNGTTYAFIEQTGVDQLYIFKYDATTDAFINTGNVIPFITSSATLSQDVAVKNGIYYACDTNGGVRIGDIETGEILAVKSIEQVPVSAVGEVFQEWDGWEFNDAGDLLQLVHSELVTSENMNSVSVLCREAAAAVIQVIIDETPSSFIGYADTRLASPLYTCYIDPTSTKLRSRGSSAAPWKGFFQAQLSITNPRRLILAGNWTDQLLFLFREVAIYIQQNVKLQAEGIRAGCNITFTGQNNQTSILKLTHGIAISPACNRIIYNKRLYYDFPSNYNVSNFGHFGTEIFLSNDNTYPNGFYYGSTQLLGTSTYIAWIGLGIVHPST